jgi:hypothetical protein
VKIKRQLVKESTLEEFADQHGLVLEIRERGGARGTAARFYCHFENSDIADGGFLVGAHGNGRTEEEAMADYAKRISESVLCIDGFRKKSRRDILVPRLVGVRR